jgi:hypothetical protein
MANFTGKLGKNKILFSEVAGALYNMIINQTVESRTIGSGMASLIDEATREVGLYGDRILKYFTDMLRVYDYEADTADQLNVLTTYRPPVPICQEMVIDTAKFIPLTLDDYLTKQGFADSATFGSFQSVMSDWLKNTKKVYLAKEYNVFVGTTEAAVLNQEVPVALTDISDLATEAEKEAASRRNAQKVAEAVANVMVAMTEDASRDYNDLGIEACFDKEDMLMVWNAEELNKITLVDLPTMYNDNEVLGALKQNIRRLPAKYFGALPADDLGNADITVKAGDETRFLHQTVVGGKVYQAGDLIPVGTKIYTGATKTIEVPFYSGSVTHTGHNQILCKIIHKDAAPVLAGFETTTEFWNPKNLSRNDYLHFLYNSFDRFTGYPWVTVCVD